MRLRTKGAGGGGGSADHRALAGGGPLTLGWLDFLPALWPTLYRLLHTAPSFSAPSYSNRPGLLSTRYVGLLGMAGSMAQFVVRYRQQACKQYSLDMGLQM